MHCSDWQLKVLRISRLGLSKGPAISSFSLTIFGLAIMQRALKGGKKTFPFAPSVWDFLALWSEQLAQAAFPAGRAGACTATRSVRWPLERELWQGRAALLTFRMTFSLRKTQLH